MRSSSDLASLALAGTFSERLIAWQRASGRHHLPWQNTTDPYRIWLSEIMLQQTQVSAVEPYYQRFLQRFPDLRALAQAPLDEVMASWAGLGYYSRARSLHRCAKTVVAELGGVFPQQPEALDALPGIGRSTAAAIAVFAFGARAAILDGNVKRVLCRVFGLERPMDQAKTERELLALAERLLPSEATLSADRAAIVAYTQGLMDLGATLCTPRRAQCPRCPLQSDCVALKTGRIHLLPTPKVRRATPIKQSSFVLLRNQQRIWFERRPERGIWGGLWCLPQQPAQSSDSAPVNGAEFAVRLGAELSEIGEGALEQPVEVARFTHAFTHFTLQARVWALDLPGRAKSRASGRWVASDEQSQLALPSAMRQLFQGLGADLLRS